MFLRQRGVGTEPSSPPPPIVPGADAQPTSAAATSAAPAAELAASYLAKPDAENVAQPYWQPLGPFYMPHGQSYGVGTRSRPSVSGRVAAVAVDPGNEQHVLCGAAGGGVWETFDRGLTWTPRTDEQPSLSIGVVVFDPANPRRVYCGTGEGNAGVSPTGNVRAAGLLVSDDGGTTWSLLPGATFTGVSFFDLEVDPTNSQHLIAATTNGLYETSDGGVSWSRRRKQLTWSVSFHPPTPGNPQTSREVFAACEDGLFRSTNGGARWTNVPLQAPKHSTLVRLEARHAPTNGSVVYVFAAYGFEDDEADPPVALLLRRSTFGDAFTRETVPPDLLTSQAWYDWFLAVAPNNPDVVYVGAVNAHRGIRESSRKWSWLNISAKKNNGDCIHPDQHAIAFSPSDPNVIYIGNDGGLYRSPDAGITWQSLNKGLCITEVEYLAQHPAYDAWILAGTQDNGTIRYEGQQTWYHVQDGDGGDCGIDDTDPYICYHSFYGAYIGKSKSGGGWNTWRGTTRDEMNDEEALFYPPLDVNGSLVVRGATQIWISRNAGSSWKSYELPGATGCPSALATPNRQLIYAATEAGELYRLDADGADWTVTRLPMRAPGYVSDMVVAPESVNTVYCTVNADGHGRVYRSADGGISWTDCSGGLPNIALHAIEIDASALGTLFVATDVGVYRTQDDGISWNLFGRGLPNVLVKDVMLHPRTRLLRAGTQARGVWEIALDDVSTPEAQIYLRDHAADTARVQPSMVDVPNPFLPGSNVFWWQSPDIKVDASPFQVAGMDDLDYDIFCDDRAMLERRVEFAGGLMDERPVRGQMARIYLQVHNRGREAARDVAARVFFIRGGLTWPDLPAGFWNGFPHHAVPASSAWQPIGPAREAARIESGRSLIMGFNWAVPLSVGNALGLLAIVTAHNDRVTPGTLNIGQLVRESRFCALRNIALMNPPPLAGPKSHATVVDLRAPAPGSSVFLELDTPARSLIRGVLLDRSLAAAARAARWREVKLSPEDRTHIMQIVNLRAQLSSQLEITRAFHPGRRGQPVPFTGDAAGGAQPVMLLFDTRSDAKTGSVIVRDDAGAVIGGITIVNRRGV